MCKVAALMITFLGSAHGFIRRSGKVNVECKKQITALCVYPYVPLRISRITKSKLADFAQF